MNTTLNIETLSLTGMVTLFNNVTGQNVKKFSDSKSAIRRLNDAMRSSTAVIETGTPGVYEIATGYHFNEDELTITKSRKGAPSQATGEYSPARGKRLGIGTMMAKLLKQKKSTQEVLDTIKETFPESRATSADVSIARRKVRDGLV